MGCNTSSITASQSNKWKMLGPLQYGSLECLSTQFNPVPIGKSIWISIKTALDIGMAEVDCESNTIKQMVPFPNDFRSKYHSVCGSNEYGIVIVNGRKGKLIEFNPKTKKYSAPVSIPKVGDGTSLFMINGNVHIIHGIRNSTNQYLIYSMITGKVTEFKDNLKSPEMQYVSTTKMENGQFIKFGGVDFDDDLRCVKSLFVGIEKVNTNIFKPLKYVFDKLAANEGYEYEEGTIPVIVHYVHSYEQEPISWRKVPEWTLKKAMCRCGVISKGPFIITFGGWDAARNGGKAGLNTIYVLDIRSKRGWIRKSIKCPLKSAYTAVLDHRQRVHLFALDDLEIEHYSIALKDIVPELEVNVVDSSDFMVPSLDMGKFKRHEKTFDEALSKNAVMDEDRLDATALALREWETISRRIMDDEAQDGDIETWVKLHWSVILKNATDAAAPKDEGYASTDFSVSGDTDFDIALEKIRQKINP